MHRRTLLRKLRLAVQLMFYIQRHHDKKWRHGHTDVVQSVQCFNLPNVTMPKSPENVELIAPDKNRFYDLKTIFAKKSAKTLPFLTRNKAKLCKKLIKTSVFEKNANFFSEN
jgi:hypothetical protein